MKIYKVRLVDHVNPNRLYHVVTLQHSWRQWEDTAGVHPTHQDVLPVTGQFTGMPVRGEGTNHGFLGFLGNTSFLEQVPRKRKDVSFCDNGGNVFFYRFSEGPVTKWSPPNPLVLPLRQGPRGSTSTTATDDQRPVNTLVPLEGSTTV